MTIVFGARAAPLAFGVVFAAQLPAAPIRQHNELRRAWGELETRRVNVELALRNTYRKGEALLARIALEHGYTTNLREECEVWADGAVAQLAGRVPDDMSRRFLAAGAGQSMPQRLWSQVSCLHTIIDDLYQPGPGPVS